MCIIALRPSSKGNVHANLRYSFELQQGMKGIKDTVKRSEAFRKAAKAAGVTVKEILWTQGQYDVVTIVEGPDEIAMAAMGLSNAKMGNITGQTLRAFTAAEMEKILAKVP